MDTGRGRRFVESTSIDRVGSPHVQIERDAHQFDIGTVFITNLDLNAVEQFSLGFVNNF